MPEERLITVFEEQVLLGTHPRISQPMPIVRWFPEMDHSGPEQFAQQLAEFFDINPYFVDHDINDDGNLEDGYGGQDGLRPWNFWVDHYVIEKILEQRQLQETV